MKTLRYAGLALLMMLFTSGSAYAVTVAWPSAASGNGFEYCTIVRTAAPAGAPDLTLVGSKNVRFYAITEANHYAIGTNHMSGTKTYGSSSDSTKVWAMNDSVKGTPSALPNTANSAVDWSVAAGWSAQ